MAVAAPAAPPATTPPQAPAQYPPAAQPMVATQPWMPAPAQPPGRSRTMLFVIIAVVAVVVVAVAALWATGVLSPKSSSSSVKITVVGIATALSVGASSYLHIGPVDLRAHSMWAISGTFTASGGGLSAYVMVVSDYNAWIATGPSGPPNSYAGGLTTPVSQGTLNWNIPGDLYYFVWLNAGTSSVALDITSDVVATSTA